MLQIAYGIGDDGTNKGIIFLRCSPCKAIIPDSSHVKEKETNGNFNNYENILGHAILAIWISRHRAEARGEKSLNEWKQTTLKIEESVR